MSATETWGIGAPLKRKEDDPLLRGRGTYVDNIDLPGTVVMVVVRSPYAHARITSIDTAAARAAEGVVGVFTGADLRDAFCGSAVKDELECVCVIGVEPEGETVGVGDEVLTAAR